MKIEKIQIKKKDQINLCKAMNLFIKVTPYELFGSIELFKCISRQIKKMLKL